MEQAHWSVPTDDAVTMCYGLRPVIVNPRHPFNANTIDFPALLLVQHIGYSPDTTQQHVRQLGTRWLEITFECHG